MAGAHDGLVAAKDGQAKEQRSEMTPRDSGAADGSRDVAGRTLDCGGLLCTDGSQVCCMPFASTPTCTTPGAACNGYTLACLGAADCASGQVCCGTFTTAGSGASCRASCPTAGSYEQPCYGDAECPVAAPKCCPYPMFAGTWYKTCQIAGAC